MVRKSSAAPAGVAACSHGRRHAAHGLAVRSVQLAGAGPVTHRALIQSRVSPSRARRRFPYNSGMNLPRPLFWAALGIVLLVSSLAGAVWVLRGSEADVSAVPSPIDPVPVAVCFGRVDVPSGVASLHPV